MIKLKNLKKMVRCFNLEHDTFVLQEGRSGVGKPEVLDMMPLEIKEVHEDVLECAEIRSALRPRKGPPTLRVIK